MCQSNRRAEYQYRPPSGARRWLPRTIPATTVDRQCGSAQQAIHFAAQGVLAGAYDVVVAAGVESMSHVPMGSAVAGAQLDGAPLFRRYSDAVVPQGISPGVPHTYAGLGLAAPPPHPESTSP